MARTQFGHHGDDIVFLGHPGVSEYDAGQMAAMLAGPGRSLSREPLAGPWSGSTGMARLRDSRRNSRRSEALSVWTNAFL